MKRPLCFIQSFTPTGNYNRRRSRILSRSRGAAPAEAAADGRRHMVIRVLQPGDTLGLLWWLALVRGTPAPKTLHLLRGVNLQHPARTLSRSIGNGATLQARVFTSPRIERPPPQVARPHPSPEERRCPPRLGLHRRPHQLQVDPQNHWEGGQ